MTRSLAIVGLGASLGVLTSCFVETGTLGLACMDAVACDPGERCDANVCVDASEPENLLANASFEDWLDDTPVAWGLVSLDSAIETTDAPHLGNTVVRATAPTFARISQTETPANPWPAGSRVEARGWTRHVAGDTAPPLLQIRVRYIGSPDHYEFKSPPQLEGSQWVEIVASVEATDEVWEVEYQVLFGNGQALQTVDFDQASLTVVPPGD